MLILDHQHHPRPPWASSYFQETSADYLKTKRADNSFSSASNLVCWIWDNTGSTRPVQGGTLLESLVKSSRPISLGVPRTATSKGPGYTPPWKRLRCESSVISFSFAWDQTRVQAGHLRSTYHVCEINIQEDSKLPSRSVCGLKNLLEHPMLMLGRRYYCLPITDPIL